MTRASAEGGHSRGDIVTYETLSGKYQAIVRRLHRDGDITIESQFEINPDGSCATPYLGYFIRLPAALAKATGEQP